MLCGRTRKTRQAHAQDRSLCKSERPSHLSCMPSSIPALLRPPLNTCRHQQPQFSSAHAQDKAGKKTQQAPPTAVEPTHVKCVHVLKPLSGINTSRYCVCSHTCLR